MKILSIKGITSLIIIVGVYFEAGIFTSLFSFITLVSLELLGIQIRGLIKILKILSSEVMS